MIAKRLHAAVADDGEPVERADFLRIDAAPYQHPIHQQPAPRVRQTVREHAEKPIEIQIGRDKYAFL